jgi:hypothetical protein
MKVMKQTAVEWQHIELSKFLYGKSEFTDANDILIKAKEMEKANHEKFNKFLNDEKQLGISDLKTIERIQWYYNTYFNETFNTK